MKSHYLPLMLITCGALLTACTKPAAVATTTGGTGSPTTTSAIPPGPTAPKLDDSLKTDAYNYYGLENTKDLTFQVTGDGEPKVGTQHVVYKEMKDGSPVFTLKRDGALVNLGDEDVQVKTDGIYLVASSFGSVTPPMMVLPAKTTVGATWKSSNKINSEDGRDFTVDGTYTVTGQEKLQVPGGTFDAIKVVAKGTITRKIDLGNGKSKTSTSPMDATEWDAPGIGTIKIVATTMDDKNHSNTSTIILTKVG